MCKHLQGNCGVITSSPCCFPRLSQAFPLSRFTVCEKHRRNLRPGLFITWMLSVSTYIDEEEFPTSLRHFLVELFQSIGIWYYLTTERLTACCLGQMCHARMHAHTHTHTHTHTHIAGFCLLHMLHFCRSGCVDGTLLLLLKLECCIYQVCLQRWQPGSLLTSGHTVRRIVFQRFIITVYLPVVLNSWLGLLVIDFIAV